MIRIYTQHKHTLSIVLRQEWRLLRADRVVWIVIALLILLISYGLYNGLTTVAFQDRTLAGVLAEQDQRYVKMIEKLRKLYAGTLQPDAYNNPDDPAWVGARLGGMYAYLPSSPLAPLALSQTDLRSNYFRVTSYNKTQFAFQDEIENPWNLLSGYFDPAFVIIYLFPLLIFALSYNLLSGEREQGTLKMLLAQPVPLTTIVMGKLLVRAMVLLVPMIILPAATVLIARSQVGALHDIPQLLLWAGLVSVYGLFWFALALAINVLGKSSATNAMLLIGVWLAFTLVVPVVLNVLITTVHPTPSRIQMMSDARNATVALGERYKHLDYERPRAPMPEGKVDVPGFMLYNYSVQRDLTRWLRPVLSEFAARLRRQQDLADSYRFLSPAVVAYEALSDLSGTSMGRYRRFENQVDAFHQARQAYFFPRVFAKTRLTEADFATMPRYTWQAENRGAVVQRTLAGLLGLLLPTALLAGLSLRGLRRYPKI